MTENDEIIAKLNSLLEKAKSSLSKDEIRTLFDLTRKRIREIEKKALNRLNKNKPNPKDNSA
jgi:DNA-directed RNA polymerase sigma subunit (sigma70/sigma32)